MIGLSLMVLRHVKSGCKIGLVEPQPLSLWFRPVQVLVQEFERLFDVEFVAASGVLP